MNIFDSVTPVGETMSVKARTAWGELSLCVPEAAGDASDAVWSPTRWAPMKWARKGASWHGCLAYEERVAWEAIITAGSDFLDVEVVLENPGERVWESTVAFTCINPGSMHAFRDYEGLRTYMRREGRFQSLCQAPRQDSPRPTVQLFSVPGAPHGTEIPFVSRFMATPEERYEPWLAIASHDRRDLLAVTTDRPYFLFQNLEFSCIHACPTMGRLEPGEKGSALTRVYLLRNTGLAEFHQRYREEFPNNPVAE